MQAGLNDHLCLSTNNCRICSIFYYIILILRIFSYEEVYRSVDTVGMRYKETTIYEDFISRIFNPTTSNFRDSSNCVSHLAAALIDTNTKYNSKGN